MKDEKEVVKHAVLQFMGKGNLDRYEDYIADEVKVHCPQSWKVVHSAEIENADQTKIIDQEYANAFSFSEMKIEDLLVHDDKIAVRWKGKGFQKAPFFYHHSSNHSFLLEGLTFYKLEECKIVEVWQSWDMLGLLNQIGYFKPGLSNEIKRKSTYLSSREKQCLCLLLKNKTARETADQLQLSFRTIEYYFENIKDKLGCESKRELFQLARVLKSHRLLE